MSPHHRLEAWRHCHQLALATYRCTKSWPPDERFGLIAQARRSAFSSAANIVEGAARKGRGDFGRYLDIALGSLAELEYCFELAADLGYLKGDELHELQGIQASAGRLTRRLHQAITGRPRRNAPSSSD